MPAGVSDPMPNPNLQLDTSELAQQYERVSAERQLVAGKTLVERLGLRPGERALDVGAGTGLLAKHVADLVGPSGSVVGIDPLPLRIEIAKRKEGPNLTFRTGTAADLGEFPDASFDVVYLNAVFHWLPDKVGPLREFRRVLRPRGRLGIATGSKEHVHGVQRVRSEVLARTPYNRFPEAKEGAARRIGAHELRDLLTRNGFRVERVDLEPSVTYHATPAATIEFAQASSFGNFLSQLPPSLRDAARADIERELERLRTPQGIRQEGMRIFAVAAKSGAE